MENQNKSECCSVHDKTIQLLDSVNEQNKKQDELLAILQKKEQDMETRVVVLESVADKIKKFGKYFLFFLIGVFSQPESLKMLLEFFSNNPQLLQ